ncbi:MAG: hypothetical protein A3J75_07755 [Acidobacteria bacterium RBG_16_68_9]|nr:MAG: hypothetical protein A3J75_07755 [Acidobacteria bacterium RBG_16_68_9]
MASLPRLHYRNVLPVVVDNGSEDGTVEELRARHREIPVIENQVNLGYAGGNNVGIRWALARGVEYVCLVNNDTEVTAELVSALVHVARSDARIGAVGARNLLMEDPSRLWGAYGVLTYGPFVVRTAGQGARDGARWLEQREVDWVIGNGCLWSRRALNDVGLLDESFFAYHDDVDWCLRARRRGFRIVYAGAAAILHRGGASSDLTQRHSFPQPYFLGRNGVIFVRKHARAQECLRFAVLCGAAMAARWMRALLLRCWPAGRGPRARGRYLWAWEAAFGRGLLDALRGRPVPFGRLGLPNSSCSAPDIGRG